MVNIFQVVCEKLEWPVNVQIEKFVRILPLNLRHFVVSRAYNTFIEVAESVKTYQELIEMDIVSHIFKHLSFEEIGCSLFHKPHNSMECPSLVSIIEMKV